MRQCYKCWKNLKDNPAYTLKRKNSNEWYLICNKCKQSSLVISLLNSGRWELIYNTPTLKELNNN